MNFIVEDGTGIQTATSYVTTAEFVNFWADRGEDYSETSEADIKAWLNKATAYIDTFNLKGHRVSRTQALQWPRWGMVHDDDWPVLSDEIPSEIKKAVMYIAAHTDTIQEINSGVQSESYGPVSKTYTGKAPDFVLVKQNIRSFLDSANILVRV